jgi:hypothetical protein
MKAGPMYCNPVDPVPAREEMRLLEKAVLHSSSVISFTFLVETPSTFISIKAKQSAFSFLW